MSKYQSLVIFLKKKTKFLVYLYFVSYVCIKIEIKTDMILRAKFENILSFNSETEISFIAGKGTSLPAHVYRAEKEMIYRF